MAIALGAGAFGVLSLVMLKSWQRDGKIAGLRAQEQISSLRALVDEYEALLAGTREVTVIWTENGGAPKFLGQASAVLPPGRQMGSILNFSSWLLDRDAESLARALEALRVHGQSFDMGLTTTDKRTIRAAGWVMGGGTALRVRPAFVQAEPQEVGEQAPIVGDLASARSVLGVLNRPAFLRDGDDKLIYANAAYHQLARSLNRKSTDAAPAEVLDGGTLGSHLAALVSANGPVRRECALGDVGRFELTEVAIAGGKAGYYKPIAGAETKEIPAQPAIAVSAVIGAVPMPVAIFGANRELIEFNAAYADLWTPGEKWLKPGMDERVILDKLRAEGMLPNEGDYKEWRKQHLEGYALKAPRVGEPWHLPGGRILQVTTTPIGRKGGVVYTFEDMTGRLKLESLNKALSSVQRETLNALSEGVAVFGTNARLTLHNPRFSALWKVPMNELDKRPHIDDIAKSAALALPEDGGAIWRELKRGIVDLNPTRSDTTGRVTRADGRLLDYTITRLPDGQTMMTFLDVTESANYSRVLKERNDALVAADQMKDAFVKNVSYELRSPLTNIIGFADLLGSGAAGVLNDKQRAYTNYIRASSETLGVLIDNILDLATVNAGIAELRAEPQDLPQLVAKARAGLAATFPEVDGEKPLNVEIDIAPDLPPFIADGTRIVQILYNLLSNAARFSEPGGVVKLSIFPRGERILFIVEDEGPGMTEEMKSAILDGLDSSVTGGRQPAAGLALAIVKTFVNLHGGTIATEARQPRGTRVIVNLPHDASMVSVAQ